MSKNDPFSVADYLLTRLKQLGLDKIFQVPGDYVAEFMEAQIKFKGIDAIGDITELGAGYAADGYARFKGIGAISVQFGVGTFSALNAVAGSYVERNPVVVITASPTTANRVTIAQTGVLFHHVTGLLDTDQKVYQNVTVAAEIISDPAEAPKQIDHALTAAITHRRPVYIEAYQNVWGEPCTRPKGKLKPQPALSQADSMAAMVSAAMSRLQTAKQPVVLLGVEIARWGLQQAVTDLLEASGLPYTTTTLGKTVLDEHYGKFIGTYAGGASIATTAEYVENSDCILTLGAILTDDYLDILQDQFGQMIVADASTDTARVGFEHYANIQMADFIGALTSGIKKCDYFPKSNVPLPTLPAAPTITECLLQAPLGYQSFFDIFYATLIAKELRDTTNLILGESSSLYMAARLLGLAQNSFISDAAWGSLGHETGAATGIAIASPKRAMVIAGDGGFMMMAQALSVISRNKLNPVVFVMSNGVYAIEQSFVDICAFTPDGTFAPFDILPKWRYKKLAKAFDVDGYQVETGAELVEVLNTITDNPKRPALVEVIIPEHDLAPAIAALVKSITGNTVDDCPKCKPAKRK